METYRIRVIGQSREHWIMVKAASVNIQDSLTIFSDAAGEDVSVVVHAPGLVIERVPELPAQQLQQMSGV